MRSDQLVAGHRRTAFQADRILHAAAELDMGVVGLAGAVADPDHVAGGGVPVAGGGIDAGHGLLEAEQQRLVAGVEIGGAHLGMQLRVDAAGAHEVERLGDAVGEFLVAVRLRAVLDEAQHPLVDVLEVGVAAGGEGAQQIQRRGRLAVGHLDAVRIRHARGGVELDAVDDVAAVARQLDVALLLGRRRARLGELAGDAADLHHRQRPGEGQHHGHLQEDAEEIADIVGAMLGEALGAVAALEQEALARGDAGKRPLELARLAGEDQRRIGGEARLDRGQGRRVGIDRGLFDRLRAPARSATSCLSSHTTPAKKRSIRRFAARLYTRRRGRATQRSRHDGPAEACYSAACAPNSLGRPTERDDLLGQRRMERGGGVEVRLGGAHLDRDGDELDQFAGVRADEVAAEHAVGVGVDDQLDEHAFVAPGDAVGQRLEVRPVDIEGGIAGAGLLLRQPDRADLGIGEHRYRHVVVVDAPSA